MLGSIEGEVGRKEGNPDGKEVGRLEGSSVGEVGRMVGTVVGPLGALVGDSVGAVGRLLGDIVGKFEGLVEGISLGTFVGNALGTLV